ncbi:hypothetical protein AYK86_14985 [Acinetobacter venetianus]|uniref:hypothetical protein n=1 Tax=Acinetobacter venetianus TaxID=52133 RepID=UPI0007757286|nr:hypothetical protein [Acinetobacter venetianus]KXO86264.1 hypothetical protein AYK86_14985 [Acinetobacter venetianus]
MNSFYSSYSLAITKNNHKLYFFDFGHRSSFDYLNIMACTAKCLAFWVKHITAYTNILIKEDKNPGWIWGL